MPTDDLGSYFAAITRRLIEAERPILARHGLSMWGYVALAHLAIAPAPTQLALAQDMGYDKNRLVSVLDELEREGLVVREPDPSDRRATIVRLTDAGAQRHASARKEIRAMEEELLQRLSRRERDVLQVALNRLTDTPQRGATDARSR